MRVIVWRWHHIQILGTERTHPRKPEGKIKSSERVEAPAKRRPKHETEAVARLQNLRKWNKLDKADCLHIFTICESR